MRRVLAVVLGVLLIGVSVPVAAETPGSDGDVEGSDPEPQPDVREDPDVVDEAQPDVPDVDDPSDPWDAGAELPDADPDAACTQDGNDGSRECESDEDDETPDPMDDGSVFDDNGPKEENAGGCGVAATTRPVGAWPALGVLGLLLTRLRRS